MGDSWAEGVVCLSLSHPTSYSYHLSAALSRAGFSDEVKGETEGGVDCVFALVRHSILW